MLSENNIVEKSKALVWAQFRDYGTGELKILDTYLSRINARDPGSSYVTFTKSEYARLMGIDPDVRSSQLKTYTRGLLSNVVTIDLPGEGYVQYPLFSEAKCILDEETNQTLIMIDCNEKLKQVFFDIAQDGYVRYQLKNVIALRSQYSIKLYTFLKDKPFGWTVGIEELKRLLGATSATYTEFKRFNSLVLKKAIDEINLITDITVEAENIKKGRTVEAIKFTVKKGGNVALPAPKEEAATEENGEDDLNDPVELSASALPPELTREEVLVLRDLALKHMPYEGMAGLADKELWMYEFLRSKTLLMKAAGAKNPFAWLKKAVAEDWQ